MGTVENCNLWLVQSARLLTAYHMTVWFPPDFWQPNIRTQCMLDPLPQMGLCPQWCQSRSRSIRWWSSQSHHEPGRNWSGHGSHAGEGHPAACSRSRCSPSHQVTWCRCCTTFPSTGHSPEGPWHTARWIEITPLSLSMPYSLKNITDTGLQTSQQVKRMTSSTDSRLQTSQQKIRMASLTDTGLQTSQQINRMTSLTDTGLQTSPQINRNHITITC